MISAEQDRPKRLTIENILDSANRIGSGVYVIGDPIYRNYLAITTGKSKKRFGTQTTSVEALYRSHELESLGEHGWDAGLLVGNKPFAHKLDLTTIARTIWDRGPTRPRIELQRQQVVPPDDSLTELNLTLQQMHIIPPRRFSDEPEKNPSVATPLGEYVMFGIRRLLTPAREEQKIKMQALDIPRGLPTFYNEQEFHERRKRSMFSENAVTYVRAGFRIAGIPGPVTVQEIADDTRFLYDIVIPQAGTFTVDSSDIVLHKVVSQANEYGLLSDFYPERQVARPDILESLAVVSTLDHIMNRQYPQ